jgi:hypothetical protein
MVKSYIKTGCLFITVALPFIFLHCNTGSLSPAGNYTTWQQYGGSADQSKFFAASQITRENVGKLEVAWVYPSAPLLWTQ